MKQFLTFIRKEFAHVFRDKKTLMMLFGMPITQIILFGFALTNEIKNADLIVIDQAKDHASQAIVRKFATSKYFTLTSAVDDPAGIQRAFQSGKARIAIVIPNGLYTDLLHLHHATIQVIADASDPNTATALTGYATAIIGSYNLDLLQTSSIPYQISPQIRMLYNPELKGAPNFVPGVMAMILLLVGVMMTSISIVRESEQGTMEILLVSPFKPMMVILSKMIPYLVISFVNVLIILGLSVTLLDLPIHGSLLLLFAECCLFITTALALGLFISTSVSSQEAAMGASLIGMMLPTMLLGGYIFPIESMPIGLQYLSNVVPSKWFYIIIKNIMLKGLGFSFVWKQTLVLAAMTIFFLVISFKKFKIRLQ
jgi:ABC-2 type transport system permease protein